MTNPEQPIQHDEQTGPTPGTLLALILRDGKEVGHIWWQLHGNTRAEILYFWLNDAERGRGMMQRLFHWLRARHDLRHVRTRLATRPGVDWLKRQGFTQPPGSADWVLVFSPADAHPSSTAS